jgi:hypothetical protein
VPHVVGSGRIVTAGEQRPGAVKEWLPARYDELVADVSEESPELRRGADHKNDRLLCRDNREELGESNLSSRNCEVVPREVLRMGKPCPIARASLAARLR